MTIYGLEQEALDSLPPMPSYEGNSVVEVAAENIDTLTDLVDRASQGFLKKLYLRISDAYLKRKYERMAWEGNAPDFLPTLRALDAQLQRPGIYTFNCAYDFFCTSAVKIEDGKPVVASTYDWGKMPRIARNLYHAEREGRGGKYDSYSVFGYAGVFRASAKDRMAVALNRAPIPSLFNMPAIQKTRIEHWLDEKAQTSRAGLLFSALGFVGSVLRGEYPAMVASSFKSYISKNKTMPILLKDVFDSEAGFDNALKRIATEPLSGSALLVIGGVDETENCAVYRTRNQCVIETTAAGYDKIAPMFNDVADVYVLQTDHVCIANHWPDHVARILGNAFDRADLPRERCENMKLQLDAEEIDIKQGVEVDSTVLYSECTPATGEVEAVAIEKREAIAYHHKI